MRQRDTYFRVAHGPAEAARGGARRRDAHPVRPRGRRRGARDPLPAHRGRRRRRRSEPRWKPRSACWPWSRRNATCCCGRASASTSTSSTGLGNFIELEGVATADSDLAPSSNASTRLTEALEIAPERILRNSYSDQVVGSSALVDAARDVMARAHAPYSDYKVGAALRAEDGSIHVGANVENAAYPQGQCAEASAIGALVGVGAFADHRGGRDRRLRRHLRAVRRLPPAPARVHGAGRGDPPVRAPARARPRPWRRCCPARSARRFRCDGSTARGARPRARGAAGTPRLGIVLGSGLGAIADALDGRHPHALRRARGLPGAERRRPRRDALHRHAQRAARRDPRPQARLRDRRRVRDDRPGPLAQGSGRGGDPAHQRGRFAARGCRPGPADGDQRSHQPAGRQPAHRAQRRGDRPALPEPARRVRPRAARASCRPRPGARRPARRRRLPRHRRPDVRDARPRSARSAPSARMRSGCLRFPR